MEYRKAKLSELDEVEEFYGDVIDSMKGSPYSPGWTRGVYPSREMLRTFISHGDMLLGLEDGVICSAMNLNEEQVPEWSTGHWTPCEDNLVSALHTLAVRPSEQRNGLGYQAVQEAVREARVRGYRTMRLDVAAHNTIARKMYEKAGFQYLETITIEYAVGGKAHYALYEYNLQG